MNVKVPEDDFVLLIQRWLKAKWQWQILILFNLRKSIFLREH